MNEYMHVCISYIFRAFLHRGKKQHDIGRIIAKITTVCKIKTVKLLHADIASRKDRWVACYAGTHEDDL